MDFEIDEKEEALRDEIRQFAGTELPEGWVGPTALDVGECRDWEVEKSISRKLAQKGWLVMSWPKEYGGRVLLLWNRQYMRWKWPIARYQEPAWG